MSLNEEPNSSRIMSRLKIRDETIFRRLSRRSFLHPLTISAGSEINRSYIRGRLLGSSCRSASMVRMYWPVALWMPHRSAGDFPRFRLKEKTRTCSWVSERDFNLSKLPSVDPSSTNTTS